MIEIFAGWIIGASSMVLALHLAGRLKPLQGADATYTGNGITAISVDIAGNNGPQIDPFYARKLAEVLPDITERLK
jgi:hypothetical protein